MSAKINVESDDPALAIALGLAIAKAIQDAGFNNVKTKTVMMEGTVPRSYNPTGFDRCNTTMTYTHGEKPLMTKRPPTLEWLMFTIFPYHHLVIKDLLTKNADLAQKPIVLSFLPDSGEVYENQVKEFLGT